MSFSLANLFNSAPAATEPAPAAAPAANGEPSATPATGEQAAAPAATPATQTPAAAENNSPLAQFESLWETTPNKDGEAPAPTFGELNPEDVTNAVAKTDFTKVITPEALAAINEGGENAQTAFVDSLNAVAKQVLTQATLVSNSIAKKMVTDALSIQEGKLPEMLRQQNITTTIADQNPLLHNPAVKPIAEAVSSQLAAKYPSATPTEILEMTSDFVTAIASEFDPNKKAAGTAGDVGATTDWSRFLQP